MLSAVLTPGAACQDFKTSQLENGRVAKAYREKGLLVQELVLSKGLDTASLNIFLRVFKHEKKMEIWASDSIRDTFLLLKEYRVCRISGKEGPKRRQGDHQVPEGLYHIEIFNPWSSFHLSLGINYPNASDRVLSNRWNPGGGIYIHGACVTIGCIPMTDELIKEIYIFAVEACNNGQEHIPVHIFPAHMKGEGFRELKAEHHENESLLLFWENLKEAFLYFETNKIPPPFTVNADGTYCIQ